MTGAIELAAPAKLNLYLKILGRRADGYHRLDSLVVFLGLHDTLSFAPAPDLSLRIEGPFAAGLEAGEGNSVLRAARLLQERRRTRAGAAITLIKRIPVAAGLGGGSSDAAQTLRALNRLWSLGLPANVLRQIGQGLGSDVPVCVFGQPAFVSGVGEIVVPAPELPRAWLLLVNPNRTLATRDVYERFPGPFAREEDFDPVVDVRELAGELARRGNDLHAAAASLMPEIEDCLDALRGQPGCLYAALSGSGPTCFGMFSGREAAHRAEAHLARRRQGWWYSVTGVLGARAPV